MKRKVVIFLILIFFVIIFGNGFGERPFENLKSVDIVDVSLLVTPPGKRIEIQDKFQIQVLVDSLNAVVMYKEDDTGRESNGQLVQFTLTMKDGSTVEVTPYGRFMFINDKCYKTEAEPCLELYTLGNRLLNYPS